MKKENIEQATGKGGSLQKQMVQRATYTFDSATIIIHSAFLKPMTNQHPPKNMQWKVHSSIGNKGKMIQLLYNEIDIIPNTNLDKALEG